MGSLIRAIFYREWIKTGRVVVILAVAMLCLSIYTMLDVWQFIRNVGIVSAVNDYLIKFSHPFGHFRYAPAILGAFMAAAQFMPEISERRLRQTLHLPCSEERIMTALLLYGNLAIGLVVSVSVSLLWLLSIDLPLMLLSKMIVAMSPWLFLAHIAYMLVSAMIIEPRWARRLSMLPMLATVSVVIFMENQPMLYFRLWWFLLFALAAACVAPYYNMYRFKQGDA